MQHRWMIGLTLAGVSALGLAQDAAAQKIAVAKIALPVQGFNTNRLTLSDVVVVGRVVGLEPMDVEATPAPNQAKVNYRIAVVQVAEALHGLKKDAKMVRVGYIAPTNNNPGPGINPGGIQIQPAFPPGPGGIRRPFPVPGLGSVALQVGQEGLFLLTKHHKENFYLVPNYNSFVSSQNNGNFANEVNNAKQLCKVLANTTASLKSDDQQQRYLAAAVLISKYRASTFGVPVKQEPIDAEESKLILKALAQGDWTPGRINATIPTPIELFNQLGISAADGYQLVNIRNQQDISQAMQKWLDENGNKYVIKKLVADPNGKVMPGVGQPGVIIQPGVIQPGGIRPLPIKQVLPLRIQIQQIQAPPVVVPPVLPAPPVVVPPLPVEPAVEPAPVRRD